MALQPEMRFMDLLEPVIEAECQIVELTPETCWRFGAPDMRPNGFYRRNLALVERMGVPVIGHGVNLSVGTQHPDDEARFATWLEWIAKTHQDFDFRWYSDHFGQTLLGSEFVALPMPTPLDPDRMDHIRRRLDRLAGVVPLAALETTAMPFWLGDPAAEPHAIERATRGHHLVLDLHNLHVMGLSGGLAPRDFIARLPLDRVIEIHLSGGGWSEPAWLPSRVAWPLDSHDDAVPEAVWELFTETWSKCPALRAVILERRDGTVSEEDIPVLEGELRRIRAALANPTSPEAHPSAGFLHGPSSWGSSDLDLAHALRTEGPAPSGVTPDLWRLAGIQIARLRWERLVNGNSAVETAFESDPEGFVRQFRRYHAEVPSHALYPSAEAEAFRQWCAGEPSAVSGQRSAGPGTGSPSKVGSTVKRVQPGPPDCPS